MAGQMRKEDIVTISQVDKRDNGGIGLSFSLSISASATENMDSVQSSAISHTSVVNSSIAGAAQSYSWHVVRVERCQWQVIKGGSSFSFGFRLSFSNSLSLPPSSAHR